MGDTLTFPRWLAWDTVLGPGKMLMPFKASQPRQSGRCSLNTHLIMDSLILSTDPKEPNEFL